MVTDARPAAPYGIAARAWLRLGAGARSARRARRRRWRRTKPRWPPRPPTIPRGCGPRARRGAATAARPARGRGVPRVARGAGATCSAASSRRRPTPSREPGRCGPADVVTRYRLGRLLLARAAATEALAAFERVVAARPSAPPTILAASCLEAARLLEARGQRARAADLYRRAARRPRRRPRHSPRRGARARGPGEREEGEGRGTENGAAARSPRPRASEAAGMYNKKGGDTRPLFVRKPRLTASCQPSWSQPSSRSSSPLPYPPLHPGIARAIRAAFAPPLL